MYKVEDVLEANQVGAKRGKCASFHCRPATKEAVPIIKRTRNITILKAHLVLLARRLLARKSSAASGSV